MSKPEWGVKHTCQSCGTKYYDLLRTPVVCPKCGAEFDPDALLRSRRTRPAGAGAGARAAEPAAEEIRPDPEDLETGSVEGEEVEVDDLEDEESDLDEDLESAEGEDEDPIEDASELGEDDDDMADVVVEDDEKPDS